MGHNGYTNSDLVNKRMNQDTYKLRRRVIDLIYEINEIIKLPRINVRITKDHDRILGSASLSKDTFIIWITEKSITLSDYDLRGIVYHEVLHTVYGIRHNKNCPLMRPIHQKGLTKIQVQDIFLKYTSKRKFKLWYYCTKCKKNGDSPYWHKGYRPILNKSVDNSKKFRCAIHKEARA